MTKKQLDGDWKRWLDENLNRGCAPEELRTILLNNQFDLYSVKEAMGSKYPTRSPSAFAAEGRAFDSIDYKAIARPRLVQTDNSATRFGTEKLQLFTIENFLSEQECEGLIDIINQYLRPSTITNPSPDPSFRTSQTCDLCLVNDPLVTAINLKISKTLGIRLPYSEGIQAQRYDVGQQFKSHTDYFEPGTSEYQQHAKFSGNRTWTFMVYLNNVDSGGGTHFLAINHMFMPLRGKAVVWNNLYPDGSVNPNTIHAGTPVAAGHKIIITKWFRERGSGPLFYE